MFTVGLTGGISSGKSTVARLFARHDVTILDADAIARMLCQPHQTPYQAIVEYFGPSCLQADNSLNRAYLADIIFNDTKAKRWLENCLHPKIRQTMQRQIMQSKGPYIICMIPLLAETMPHPYLNRILVIDIEPSTQLERLMQRDHLSSKQAKQRIKQQASRQERIAIADDIIINQGSTQQLKRSIRKKHELYLSLSEHKKNKDQKKQ